MSGWMKAEHFDNLSDLPPKAYAAFIKAEAVDSIGFHEVVGYINRTIVWAMNGHWSDEQDRSKQKSHITSMGAKCPCCNQPEQLFKE